MQPTMRKDKRAGLERDGGQVPDRHFIGVIAEPPGRVTRIPKTFLKFLPGGQRVAARVQRGSVACRRGALASVNACSLVGMRSSPQAGSTAADVPAGTSAPAAGVTAAGREDVPAGQRSVTSPVPAHSRAAAIPAATAALSSNGPETAISVPSGASSRNRKNDSASTNASNLPAMTILPWAPGGSTECGRGAPTLTRPSALSLCKLHATAAEDKRQATRQGACRRRNTHPFPGGMCPEISR